MVIRIRLPSSRGAIARLDAVLIGLVLIVLSVWVGWRLWRQRDALVVWSCGGNYEFLVEYVREFESRESCCVRYTAAPVQYLLDLS